MLMGFNHLTLAVGHLSRSIDFYREALGFKLSARWKTGAYLTLGDLWLCLASDSVQSQDLQRHYTHYAFSIEQKDFSTFSRRLRELDIPLWKQDASEGNSLYFLDPDGHQLEAHVGDLTSRLAACRRHPYSEMEFFD